MRRRVFTLGATAAVGVLFAGGCEDPAAQRRAEVHQLIEEASRDLHAAAIEATSPDDGAAQQAARRLTEIVRVLSSVRDAEAGQQSAAALIASTASRELGGVSMGRVEAIESANRRTRAVLHSHIDAALRLRARADGAERFTTSGERALLAGERAVAQERLHVYSERLAELDGPIATNEGQNESDALEATRLENEAIVLRRQAAEWGHADGLATFEQALHLERQADRFEYDIAHRESSLQYELRPEHELANSQVTYLKGMLDEIESTEDDLGRRDEVGRNQVREVRVLLARYQGEITAALDGMRSTESSELAALYDEAQGHLEKAVSQARQAASKGARGEVDAARLALARAHERQGQIFLGKARGLSTHAAVLDRLVRTGGALGDLAQLQAELTATVEAETQAIEQAKEQFTSARDQLDQVKSRTSQTEVGEFRQGLEDALAIMTGDAPAPRRTAGGSGAAPARTSGGGGGGFATPEALIEVINSASPSDPDAMRRMLDTIRVTTPGVQRMLALQRRAMGPAADLINAMVEKFGAMPGELSSLEGSGAGAMSNVRILERSDDRVTIGFDTAPGMPEGQTDLLLVDGAWVIDGDAMLREMPAGGAEQAEQVAEAMMSAMTDLARRVRAGEFSSPDEVGEAMMGAIMGAAGGMPTRPPGN